MRSLYTIPSSLATFNVLVPFEGGTRAYGAGRNMLRVQYATTGMRDVAVSLVNNSDITDVRYMNTFTTGPDGVLVVSIRHIVRMAIEMLESLVLPRLIVDDGTDSCHIAFRAYRGADYADIVMPREKGYDGFTLDAGLAGCVVPPNVIYDSDNDILRTDIYAECNLPVLTTAFTVAYSGVEQSMTPQGGRNNELHFKPGADYISILDTQTNRKVVTHITHLDNCDNAVCLRWRSQTGAVRQHIFLVDDITRAVDGSVGLVSFADGYIDRKRVSNSFNVRIESLTAYGVWYYSDLVQADDVHCVRYSTMEDITGEETSCVVEGAPVVTPSGNGFFTFTAKIKLSHYDSY